MKNSSHPKDKTPTNDYQKNSFSAEFIDHAYSQLPVALLATYCLSLLLAIVLWKTISVSILAGWLAVIWGFSSLRALLYYKYRRATESGLTTDRWHTLFVIGVYFSATIWGSAGIILFPQESAAHQVLLAFVLGGLVAGGTSSLAALQGPMRFFVVLILAPITIRFFLLNNEVSFDMGLMIILYGGMCAIMSSQVHKILMASFRLRQENREEIKTRKLSEEKLRKYKDKLEETVNERTQTLLQTNEKLAETIESYRQTESEKHLLENRLSQAQKMEAIGTLAGGIAHDFNNILTAIIGNAELALLKSQDADVSQDNIREIINAGVRARDLVKQILAFSRRSEGNLSPISLQTTIKEILKLLRATIPMTVEIKWDIDQGCGTVSANPIQIHQIIMNLCTNAVHAMKEKGVLQIDLKEISLGREGITPPANLKPGRFARLSITDTGSGMDKRTMEQIFDPFFTTKEVGEGTGMGLSVVHGIVESHHGAITVESEPGKGSTFHLYFPTIASELAEISEDKTPISTGTERILFVDDEEMVASASSSLLETLGYTVTTLTESRAALEIFKSNPDAFDLVITDQTMPGMTGHELAVELLRIRPDLPIILYTGFSTQFSEKDAKAIGIRRYILKPFNRKQLADSVREVLDGG